jgi:putative ABC transport system permease protein
MAELPRLATLTQAVHSLSLHRLRATLSALGIVCGVMSFVAMLSLSEGARRETIAQIEQLGMRNVLIRAMPLTEEQRRHAATLGSQGLALADAQRLLAALPRIARVAAVREVRATVVESDRERAPLVLAVTPNFLALQGLEVERGRPVADDDFVSRSLVCVLGHDVARRLGPAGQPGATLRIEDSVCKVVGVLRHFERRSPKGAPIGVRDYDNAVALPLGAENAFAGDFGIVTELVAEMRSSGDVVAALPVVRRALEVAHRGVDDYRVIAPQELLRQAHAARRNFDVLAGSLAVLCLVAGGIGIMNTMLASVTERTREIGIRRAVGATRSHIAAQFLAEATVLTGAGAAAGLLIGVGAVHLVSTAAGWPVAISAPALGIPALAAIAAGLFFGIHPAVQAARLDPIAALRHN